MFALFCVFLLFIGGIDSWKVYKKRDDQVEQIQPPVETHFGKWGPKEYCAPGSYAYSFEINVGNDKSDDDTGVNGIILFCRPVSKGENDRVGSTYKMWGHWEGRVKCPGQSYLTGVSMKSQKHIWWRPRYDDTAVNNVQFTCQDGTKLKGEGGEHGEWGKQVDCPANSAICGIKTLVEDYIIDGDNTSLNEAIFYCCKI